MSEIYNRTVKSKAIPLQAWTGPEGSRRVEAPRFQDSRQMKVVRLSALRTGRIYLLTYSMEQSPS